ncbi:hypothetical protein PE067_08405 [Paracoccus sp. DMF-8]|uniref:hypothetical protein n=1 Tax=Paracoccus sp. DMF-8 TaxID=3019445 RepID=UPI0023E8B913|nr:hypothetical protein [Paracoccus sp. DMF-8]MDF3606148.1 hypothetical protein [Paracoccus sp. DMF-8]
MNIRTDSGRGDMEDQNMVHFPKNFRSEGDRLRSAVGALDSPNADELVEALFDRAVDALDVTECLPVKLARPRESDHTWNGHFNALGNA